MTDHSVSQINRLIAWLSNRPFDWFNDWSIDWLIDWLTGWLIDWLVDWLIDWSTVVDWPICTLQALRLGRFRCPGERPTSSPAPTITTTSTAPLRAPAFPLWTTASPAASTVVSTTASTTAMPISRSAAMSERTRTATLTITTYST